MGHISVSQLCYICMCIHAYMCNCHIHNQSITNVTVYIQVYMQVYLHIYIHIYVQVAHNFDYNLLCYNVEIWYDIYKTLYFMVEWPLGGAWGQNVEQVILNTCKMAIES